MEATLLSHHTLPARQFLASPLTIRHKKMTKIAVARKGDNNNQDRHCGGSNNKIVDENMIVLRMRIKEMKALECEDGGDRMDWMGWEKEYLEHYKNDVCEILGLLQWFLMESRPAFGLGVMAIVVASVPFSTFVVILHAIEMAKGLLSTLPN